MRPRLVMKMINLYKKKIKHARDLAIDIEATLNSKSNVIQDISTQK